MFFAPSPVPVGGIPLEIIVRLLGVIICNCRRQGSGCGFRVSRFCFGVLG